MNLVDFAIYSYVRLFLCAQEIPKCVTDNSISTPLKLIVWMCDKYAETQKQVFFVSSTKPINLRKMYRCLNHLKNQVVTTSVSRLFVILTTSIIGNDIRKSVDNM